MPSRWSRRSFFTVPVSLPYKRILSTHALKKSSLVFLEIFDCQIMCSLLQAFQAWALRVRKSFLLSATKEPRYLKSSTSLSCVPSLERIEAGHSFPLIDIYSVLLAFWKTQLWLKHLLKMTEDLVRLVIAKLLELYHLQSPGLSNTYPWHDVNPFGL